jgi:hypothetical protein
MSVVFAAIGALAVLKIEKALAERDIELKA